MKDTKIFCACSNSQEVLISKFMLKHLIKKNKRVEYIPLNLQDYFLQPYLNETSTLLYLYEHQELLGEAKYIGICHYRRIFFDLTDDYIDFLNENKNNYISGCIRYDNADRNNRVIPPILNSIFRTYSESTKVNIINLINSFIKIYPELSNMYMKYSPEEVEEWDYEMPERNIFILNREEFINICRFYHLFLEYLLKETTGKELNADNFEYFIKYKCLQVDRFADESFTPIFGVKEDIKDINNPIPYRTICKRHFAYFSEFITAWYLLRVLGKNYKVCQFIGDDYIMDNFEDDFGYRCIICNDPFDESTLDGWDK